MPFPGEHRCGNFKGQKGDWHRNRAGKPCGFPLAKGQIACKFHGGATPRVQVAAVRRAAVMEAHEHARRLVDARAGTEASDAEILLDLLWTANAQRIIWGQMVADLDHAGEVELQDEDLIGRQRGYIHHKWVPTDIDDAGKVVRHGHVETKMDPLMVRGRQLVHMHPFVEQFNHWVKESHAIVKTCALLNIADRQVRVAERYADTLFELMEIYAEAVGADRAHKQVGRRAVAAHMQKLQLVG